MIRLSKASPSIVLRQASLRPAEAFDLFWAAYPKRDGSNPRAPAEKKFAALLKSGVELEVILAGCRAHRDECSRRGQIGAGRITRPSNSQRGPNHHECQPRRIRCAVTTARPSAPSADRYLDAPTPTRPVRPKERFGDTGAVTSST
jgi:hypothetical protein